VFEFEAAVEEAGLVGEVLLAVVVEMVVGAADITGAIVGAGADVLVG